MYSTYVKMPVQDAVRIFNGGKGIVLIAIKDLENEDDDCVPFAKYTIEECLTIIQNAKTVAQVLDDFVKQYWVFSEHQPDLHNILPIGRRSTIIVRE